MARVNSFLITTTSSLENYLIKEYLGTVSANIVTGTGLFTDMGAGIRDIFGGRSQGYQKQLQIINEEVLKKLESVAKRLGANSIIGTRIDYDEISGKGMQMFMVTASGTAVIIKREKKLNEEEAFSDNQVDADEISERIHIDWSINALKNEKLKQVIEWELLRKRQVVDALEPILRLLVKLRNSDDFKADYFSGEYEQFQEAKKSFYNEATTFFLSLPASIINEYIYNYFCEERDLFSFIEPIIKEGKLLDLEKIYDLLGEKSHLMRKRMLRLLLYDKQFYNKEDVAQFESLCVKIREAFPDLSATKEGGVFSKKEKWVCAYCRASNESSRKYCSSCGNDKFGFKERENNPEYIISFLEQKVSIIKEQLKLQNI